MDISVIIPTYNKFDHLKKTLSMYNNVIYDRKKFEVIVVINGWSIGKEDLLNKLILNYNLKIIKTNKKGRAMARNLAIKNSCGDILIFNDDDTLPCKEFLNIHNKLNKDNPKSVIIGERKQACIDDLSLLKFSDIKDISYSGLYYKKILSRIFQTGKSRHWISCISANLSMSKETLKSVGMFDQNFTGWGLEDFELGYRLSHKGYNFIYDSSAINYHIEHKRNKNAMIEAMNKNMIYFYQKYNRNEELYYFWEFYCGRISLEEYDSKSYNELNNDKKTYFKIFSRSNITKLEADLQIVNNHVIGNIF